MGIARLMLLKGVTEATFGHEVTSASTYDIEAIDPQLNADQLMHESAENQQRITQFAGYTLGRKSNSRVTFGVYLKGDGVALSSGATTTGDSLNALLLHSMGGRDAGKGSVISAATTTSVTVTTSGCGAKFLPGKAILVETSSATAEWQQTIVRSCTTSTGVIHLEVKLSAVPGAGAKVINSHSYYIDPSATATYQFRAHGDDAADIWLMLGCIGGFSIADLLQIEAGQLPRLNFDYGVTEWQKETGTLAAGSFDGAALLGTTSEMEIHYQTHGTYARNLISVSAIDPQPNITWTMLPARGNADHQHVDRWRMTGVAPSVSFTADPAAAFWTVHSAQTEKRVTIMFGKTPGSSWCIDLPRLVMSAVPQRGTHAEQVATQCAFRALEDDAAANALGRSPIRIHRL